MAAKKTPAKKAPAGRKAAPAKQVPIKRHRGRQTTYSPDAAAKIIAGLEQGTPLAVICREEGMPAVRTVSDWKKARPVFAASFARARDEGYDALAAQCMEIADTPLEGVRIELGEDGKTKQVVEDMLGHRKLQIETRLKLLARWDPKRYGDKVQLAQAEDLQPLTVVVKKYSE